MHQLRNGRPPVAASGDVRPVDPAAARRRERAGHPAPWQPVYRGYSNGPAKPERPYVRGARREDWAVAALHRALAEHGPAPEDIQDDYDGSGERPCPAT